MDNTIINIFKGVTDKDTSKTISILDVLWKISNGEWKKDIELYRSISDKKDRSRVKKSLPCVTFSGQIGGNERLDDNLTHYSHVMVLDIDKISTSELKRYRSFLSTDGYVLAFFNSPSMGLKVLVKVSSKIEHHRTRAFEQVGKYFHDNYDIEIDPSGKNPSRLCFVSYDEDMYFNEDYSIFPVDETLKAESEKEFFDYSRVSNSQKIEISNDSRYVFSLISKWITKSKTGPYRKGNRNNYIFSLACRLSDAGVTEMTSADMILSKYFSLTQEEILATIKSAYKKTAGSFGSKPIIVRKGNQSGLF